MNREEREEQEKREMEKTIDQKINWVEPEERYVNQGEYIGPNTYRSGKMGHDFEETYENTSGSISDEEMKERGK